MFLLLLVLGALLLVYVLWPLARGEQSEWEDEAATDSLRERHEAALLALREVEAEHELNKLADADYFALRERYARQAMALLRLIEQREHEKDVALEEAIAARRHGGQRSVGPVQTAVRRPLVGTKVTRRRSLSWILGSGIAGAVVLAGISATVVTIRRGSAAARAWRPSPIPGARALTFDPSTGYLFVASAAALEMSTNGGASWQPRQSSLDLAALRSLFPAPDGKGIAALLTTGKLWVSANDGQSWKQSMALPLPAGTRSVAIVPEPQRIVVVATASGVEASSDNGRSWAAANGLVNGLLPQTPVHAVAYAATADQATGPNGAVYRGLLFAATDQGLFVSRDDGGSWFAGAIATPLLAVSANPKDPQVIVALDARDNLYLSQDGGHTWQQHS
ncbi:MAG: hypothetical protein M1118_12490 [Chloroflexi bacterium]|nr:hypothetical protein [Chloroflexota bacterium]